MDTDPSQWINGLDGDSNKDEVKPKIDWDDEKELSARSRARKTENQLDLATAKSATTPPIDLNTVKEEDIRPKIEWDGAAEQEAFAWLESTVNPKLKKKTKPEDVPIQTIHHYMKPIPIFDVDREQGTDIDLAVSRGFISREFGGSPQGAFPKVREEKRREMVRDGFGEGMFNFMNWDYHPYMPTQPGFPGLYLNIISADEMMGDDLKYDWETTKEVEDEERKVKVEDGERKRGESEEEDGVHRVFVRLDANQWLYVGQYIIKHRAILSKEEWDELSYTAKSAWINGALVQGWGEVIRARVFLLNRPGSGRRCTEQELRKLLKDKTKLKSLKVTKKQIMDSFDREEYRVTVATMTCIGYQHEFQRKIVDKYPLWLEEQPQKSKKGTQGKKRTRKSNGRDDEGPKAKKVKARRTKTSSSNDGHRRRQTEYGGSDSEDASGSEYEDGAEIDQPSKEDENIVYISSGTKSRPRTRA